MLRPDLPPLDAYLSDAVSLHTEDFLERYPWPFLIVPEPHPNIRSRMRRPETVVHDVRNMTEEFDLANAMRTGASLDAVCLEIRPKRGGMANRISIGRSPDADVVILHESVSRFHADISWGADKNHCIVADLGARNGTFLDGVRLSAHSRAQLYPGAVVTFGTIVTRFYSPEAFLSWLEAGAPRSGAAPAKWPDSPKKRTHPDAT